MNRYEVELGTMGVMGTLIGMAVFFLLILAGIWFGDKYCQGDGLNAWRESKGIHLTEVTYQGKTYYCDNAEIPAGHPDRIILYRGKNAWLMFPEKNAAMNLPINE